MLDGRKRQKRKQKPLLGAIMIRVTRQKKNNNKQKGRSKALW